MPTSRPPRTLWRCKTCFGKSGDDGFVYHIVYCKYADRQPVQGATGFNIYDLRVVSRKKRKEGKRESRRGSEKTTRAV